VVEVNGLVPGPPKGGTFRAFANPSRVMRRLTRARHQRLFGGSAGNRGKTALHTASEFFPSERNATCFPRCPLFSLLHKRPWWESAVRGTGDCPRKWSAGSPGRSYGITSEPALDHNW